MDNLYVWQIEIPTYVHYLSAFEEILDQNELRRANKLRVYDKRVEFVVCRAILKLILADFIRVDVSEINFIYNEHGKPELSDHIYNKHMLHFNLSHSYDYVQIVLSKNCPVGVDIELIVDDSSIYSIAKYQFTDNEFRGIDRAGKIDGVKCFYSCWVRKEAFVKGYGLGLAMSLDSFEVDVGESESNLLVANIKNRNIRDEWSIFDLHAPEGYVSAVAVKSQSVDIQYQSVNDQFLHVLC